MPITPTPAMMRDYATGKTRYVGYDTALQTYNQLKIHADGEMPTSIIDLRRPSESEMIKQYRQDIYEPKTQITVGKVITSLSKIRRSQDWSISYNPDLPARLKELPNETLQAYCEKNFPYFGSVTNWAFSVLLRNMQIDSNAVAATWPLNRDASSIEFFKPFPVIFNSDQVLDYQIDDYAVLLSSDSYIYRDKDQIERTGIVMYVIDRMSVQRWVQTDLDKTMGLDWNYPHGLAYLPARRLGGVFMKAYDNVFLFKSRIQDMVPCLNEAVRLYSDLQAEIVQHVHSDKWVYSNTECRHCNGSGKIETEINNVHSTCKTCEGIGYVSTSPYKNMVLRPLTNMESGQVPTPPAGYVQKSDVALMVDKMNGLVKQELYDALSAVNMQFLDQTPLNQSGTAKEVDRDELNNFVYSVAEDIVSFLDWLYQSINDYRYKDFIPNAEERKGMLPQIPVPEKFDLLSSTLLLDDLAKAKQNGINPEILNELQLEYSSKKFYNDHTVKDRLEMIFLLDPFPNISDDDKMVRLNNNGITEIDYIISSNIQQFVRRAMEEDVSFASKPMNEQRGKMIAYAEDVIKSHSDKESMISEIPEDVTFEEPVTDN